MDTQRTLHLALFSTLIACSASNARDPHFDPATLSPDDPRAHCEVGRWCWLDGEPFVAMHGLTAESLVAASARGEMWRFNGSRWEPLGFPVSLAEPSIFAASPSDVWVAGEGRLFHYDGAAWTERDATASGVPSGQWPLVLTGTGPSDVWAYVSEDTTVMHFDGVRWSASQLEGSVMGFLAVREGEAWVVDVTESGLQLSIKRFDGIGWVEMLAARGTGYPYRLLSVDGEIWFLGDEPQRFVDGEWLPLDRTRYLSDETTNRVVSASGGLVALPAGFFCNVVHVVGTTTFCLKQDDELIWHSTDNVTWTRTAVDTLDATMPPEAFDDYAPNVWAGEAEFAWGLAPEGTVRFRPVTLDMRTAPMLMLERASVTGTFEPVTGPGGEPIAGAYPIDIDGAPLGPTWLAMDDALHALSPEGVLTPVELPLALEGARVARVAAIDADSAIFVAHRLGTEFVLRLDGGSVRTLLERSDRGEGSVEIDDVAVDADGGLWVIGLADRPHARAGGVAVLFHSSDGEAWARRDLWPSWGGAQLVADGDALWIHNGPIFQLRREVMRGAGPVVAENLLVRDGGYEPRYWPRRGRLHVDETGVWLSTNDRALWLPR